MKNIILSLINTKGGTGKSTAAHCLAYSNAFAKAFKSVALVELDDQGTLRDWYRGRAESKRAKDRVGFFDLAGSSQKELADMLAEIIENHEAVILDIPGESVGGFATNLALHLSSLALVPLRSSEKDEKAFLNNLYPVILAAGGDTRWLVVPNHVHPNTKLENVLAYYKHFLPPPVGCLPARMASRAVYENYDSGGATLIEYARSVKDNAKEFEQARNAVFDIEQIASEILKAGVKK